MKYIQILLISLSFLYGTIGGETTPPVSYDKPIFNEPIVKEMFKSVLTDVSNIEGYTEVYKGVSTFFFRIKNEEFINLLVNKGLLEDSERELIKFNIEHDLVEFQYFSLTGIQVLFKRNPETFTILVRFLSRDIKGNFHYFESTRDMLFHKKFTYYKKDKEKISLAIFLNINDFEKFKEVLRNELIKILQDYKVEVELMITLMRKLEKNLDKLEEKMQYSQFKTSYRNVKKGLLEIQFFEENKNINSIQWSFFDKDEKIMEYLSFFILEVEESYIDYLMSMRVIFGKKSNLATLTYDAHKRFHKERLQNTEQEIIILEKLFTNDIIKSEEYNILKQKLDNSKKEFKEDLSFIQLKIEDIEVLESFELNIKDVKRKLKTNDAKLKVQPGLLRRFFFKQKEREKKAILLEEQVTLLVKHDELKKKLKIEEQRQQINKGLAGETFSKEIEESLLKKEVKSVKTDKKVLKEVEEITLIEEEDTKPDEVREWVESQNLAKLEQLKVEKEFENVQLLMKSLVKLNNAIPSN